MCNRVLSGWTDLHGHESPEQAPVAQNWNVMLHYSFPASDAPERLHHHKTVPTTLLDLLLIPINKVRQE